MRTTDTHAGAGLIHAGAGTGLALVQLAALFPGLLPILGLAAVFVLPLLIPFVVLGALAAVPWSLWRLARRRS